MKSQTPGRGQAYLGSYTDADGAWLDGGRDYTLHVPADPPAKLFWSATVYDVATRCLIDNEQQRGDRGSRDPDSSPTTTVRSTSTSARTAPAGRRVELGADHPRPALVLLLPLLRPLEPYFDRSWKLGDITPV